MTITIEPKATIGWAIVGPKGKVYGLGRTRRDAWQLVRFPPKRSGYSRKTSERSRYDIIVDSIKQYKAIKVTIYPYPHIPC